MAITVPNPLESKHLELYGAGFGILSYEGKPLDLVANFRDSGQPALGQPQDIMTINDRYPRTIVTPMAIASGTVSFDTYGLKDYGIWGTVFNGRFGDAKTLVNLFTRQLELGAVNLFWTTVDVAGTPTKVLQYQGLVVTNAQRNVTVTNTGATVASHTFTCKYTLCSEKVG